MDEIITLEGLKSLLKKDKVFLNHEMYDYLEGVINLDYSVVKELITKEQREALNDLKLYKNALIYNIQKLDRDYFNIEYLKNDLLFFYFYINEDNIPTITLFNRIASKSAMNDPYINKKIQITQAYLARIKDEYGLTDNELDVQKTLVKEMPGLIINQNITKY